MFLGYGAIGRMTALHITAPGSKSKLFARENMHVYDKDPAKRAQAAKDGFAVLDSNKALNGQRHQYQFVLGAAGRNSLTLKEILEQPSTDKQPLLANGAALISCSSGTIEFPFHELVSTKLPTRLPSQPYSGPSSAAEASHPVLDSPNIHQNVTFRLPDGR